MPYAGPGLSVVIPVYNEAEAVQGVLESLLAGLKQVPGESEIIVVDDGSTDRGPEILARFPVRVLRHPENLGYGQSLSDGIRAARHDTIVIMDGDGSYAAEDIPELIRWSETYDMVVGVRLHQESIFKAPLRRFFRLLAEFTVGRSIPDVNSGLRVFRRERALTIMSMGISQGFSFTTSLTLAFHLSGHAVRYVPIRFRPRLGRAKIRLFRDSLRALQIIFETIAVWNPVKFFILMAVFPFAAGGAVLVLAPWLGWGVALLGCLMAWCTGLLTFSLGFVGVIFRRRPP